MFYKSRSQNIHDRLEKETQLLRLWSSEFPISLVKRVKAPLLRTLKLRQKNQIEHEYWIIEKLLTINNQTHYLIWG